MAQKGKKNNNDPKIKTATNIYGANDPQKKDKLFPPMVRTFYFRITGLIVVFYLFIMLQILLLHYCFALFTCLPFYLWALAPECCFYLFTSLRSYFLTFDLFYVLRHSVFVFSLVFSSFFYFLAIPPTTKKQVCLCCCFLSDTYKNDCVVLGLSALLIKCCCFC